MDIIYSRQALKFLQKQEKAIQQKIISAIEMLPLGDIKHLQGRSEYRLRVGTYRIIFNRKGQIIYIEKIDNRGQVYRR